jgi:phenylpropionate dioxygenase-like ring-hydroxylating dioxygenase large terminal subunit
MVDREALDRSIARRLLDHIEDHTTDMTDEVLQLPMEIYTSEDYLERELELLFRDQPLVFCLSGALPRPYSYYTTELIGVPLLLTRDADGRAHAFANVCRHRGVRVVDGYGEARRFTCPFHAWVYDAKGKLVGVPVAEAFEGMCREDKGLIELPVAEGHGLVVGRLRPGEPVDIDSYLGPGLVEELTLLDFADWELLGDPHVHEVKANWKVQLDTYRENYHFDYLHRNTLGEYAYGGVLIFDAFGPHLRNSTAIRSIDELKGRPEKEWDDPFQHISYQYAFFPNSIVSFDYRHVELWQVLPAGAHHSRAMHGNYMRPGLSEEQTNRFAELAPWICQAVVDGEDFRVAGRTEPGIQTGLVDRVVFGRNEPAPQHLHRGFLAVLGESTPSAATAG